MLFLKLLKICHQLQNSYIKLISNLKKDHRRPALSEATTEYNITEFIVMASIMNDNINRKHYLALIEKVFFQILINL